MKLLLRLCLCGLILTSGVGQANPNLSFLPGMAPKSSRLLEDEELRFFHSSFSSEENLSEVVNLHAELGERSNSRTRNLYLQRNAVKALAFGFALSMLLHPGIPALAGIEPNYFSIDPATAGYVLTVGKEAMLLNLQQIKSRMEVVYPLIGLPHDKLTSEMVDSLSSYQSILKALEGGLESGSIRDAATFNDYIIRAISALGDDHIRAVSNYPNFISGAIFTPTSPDGPADFAATLGLKLMVWQNPKTFEKHYWVASEEEASIEVVVGAAYSDEYTPIKSKEKLNHILEKSTNVTLLELNGRPLADYLQGFFAQYVGSQNADVIAGVGEKYLFKRPLSRFPLGSDHGEPAARLVIEDEKHQVQYEVYVKWNLVNEAPKTKNDSFIMAETDRFEKSNRLKDPVSPFFPNPVKVANEFDIRFFDYKGAIAAMYTPSSFSIDSLGDVYVQSLLRELKLMKSIGMDIQWFFFDVSENPGGELNKARSLATMFLEEDLDPVEVAVQPSMQAIARIAGFRNVFDAEHKQLAHSNEINKFDEVMDQLEVFSESNPAPGELFEIEIIPTKKRLKENLQDIGITPMVFVNENTASAAEFFASYAQLSGVEVIGTSPQTRGMFASLEGLFAESFPLTGLTIVPINAVLVKDNLPAKQQGRFIIPDRVIEAPHVRAFWEALGKDIFEGLAR